MSGSEVSRLFGFSPVTTIRAIVSSVWSPMDSFLHTMFGIPGRVVSFCSGCLRLASTPVRYLLGVGDPVPAAPQAPNLKLMLTGVEDPTSKHIADKVKELQSCTINTIINQISQRNKLQEYRSELQRWKEENEKEMAELFNLNERDRITMKSLALSVKKLKALKGKKTKYTKLNNEQILKAVRTEKISQEDIKVIKETNKNLKDIDSEIIKNKKDCLEMVKTSDKLSQIFTKVLLHNDSFYDYTLDSDMPLNTVNKLRAITYRSQIESEAFKSTLMVTNEKLDKILTATEKISVALADFKGMPEIPSLRNELVALRSQIEQDQFIIRNVTDERDIMRVKLDALEDLIEDQESFLNSREWNGIQETAVH